MLKLLLACILLFGVASAAVTKKDRKIDTHLSDKEFGSPDYDHDAFLGEEKAQEFDNLPPEESKRRLAIIAQKIDTDGNSEITEKELEDWIIKTQQRYIRDDTSKQFSIHDKDKNNEISWEEYKEVTYGFLEDDQMQAQEDDGFSYKQMLERDERRWLTADQNHDGVATEEEFRAFLHPEEFEHMKDIVIKETMDDIDKDKDGFISVDEYIGDMFNPANGEEEPEWIDTERNQFAEYRDKNKDGKLDADEVRDWILPDDYNHAEAEAKHLIYESDDSKDGVLSIDEIMTHYEKFVGSQATNWGEALHDEF